MRMGCCCCPDTTPVGDIQTDEFCGNFLIPCGTGNVVVWEADPVLIAAGAQTGGTVSIFYERGCDDSLSVAIRNFSGTIVRTLEVPPGNTRSFTSLELASVTITCQGTNGGTDACRGKYCINYHYDVLQVQGP